MERCIEAEIFRSRCNRQRIRGFLNDMRYINSRFTYLLTYFVSLALSFST